MGWFAADDDAAQSVRKRKNCIIYNVITFHVPGLRPHRFSRLACRPPPLIGAGPYLGPFFSLGQKNESSYKVLVTISGAE